jgi:hypothetical protein
MATLFFVVCMALAYVSSHRNDAGSQIQSVTSVSTEEVQGTTSVESDLPPVDSSADEPSGSDLPPAE